MSLVIVLIVVAAICAMVAWIAVLEDEQKCFDCFHLLEEHGHSCRHAGCCCQYSQAELSALAGAKGEKIQ